MMDNELLTPEEMRKRDIFKERLEELGYDLSDRDINAAFIAFKDMAAQLEVKE